MEKDKLKEEIKKVMKENDIEVSEKFGFSDDDVDTISVELMSREIISFSIEQMCRHDECFMMAWYYSGRMKRLIVLDVDFGNLDDVDEMVDAFIGLEKEVEEIEKV